MVFFGHPIEVEFEKGENERGKYLCPSEQEKTDAMAIYPVKPAVGATAAVELELGRQIRTTREALGRSSR